MARHPGGGENNTRTHQGPTTISDGGQTIEFRPPFPGLWADLYTTWNMAFVTIPELSEAWPYWLVKLVIPSVSLLLNVD